MEISFEAALLELEDIVKKLESGAIELEQAIEFYARGAELKNFCESKLKDAKMKVSMIIEADGKVLGTEEFE
jgi:exodeoxyribonuclease VII small subunit